MDTTPQKVTCKGGIITTYCKSKHVHISTSLHQFKPCHLFFKH